MATTTYDPETFLKIAIDNPEWTNKRIGKEVGADEATVRRALAKLAYRRNRLPIEYQTERFEFRLDKPEVIDGDWALTADWHVPLTNFELVNRFLDQAGSLKIKNLLIAGDALNGDQVSQYFPKQEDAGKEREIKEWVAILNILLEQFDHILVLMGNHDYRYVRARNYEGDFKTLMWELLGPALGSQVLDANKVSKLQFSNLDHCWHHAADGERTRICHPDTYSRIPLTVARQLASKYNCNVATAHSHHCALGYAVNGTNWVCEMGGFMDPTTTGYLRSTSTFPEWQPGWMFMINDRPEMWTPHWSMRVH